MASPDSDSIKKREDDEDEEDSANIEEGRYKAPVLVTTHRERMNVIDSQCCRLARENGTKVIRWPCETRGWKGEPLSIGDVGGVCYKDPCFWEYFVEGADGFVTEIVDKKLGIIGGTKIRYSFLIPGSEEEEMELHAGLASSDLVVSLTKPPGEVYIELVDADPIEWADISYVRGKVEIPLGKVATKWRDPVFVLGDENGRKYGPSGISTRDHFPCELAFAIISCKAQGCTTD